MANNLSTIQTASTSCKVSTICPWGSDLWPLCSAEGHTCLTQNTQHIHKHTVLGDLSLGGKQECSCFNKVCKHSNLVHLQHPANKHTHTSTTKPDAQPTHPSPTPHQREHPGASWTSPQSNHTRYSQHTQNHTTCSLPTANPPTHHMGTSAWSQMNCT